MYFTIAGPANNHMPPNTRDLFIQLVNKFCYDKEMICRNGAIQGFEQRIQVPIRMEVYTPSEEYEKDFINKLTKLKIKTHNTPSLKARYIASQSSMNWEKLSRQAKYSAGSFTHRLMGPDLKSKSKFLLTYSEDNGLSGHIGLMMRIAADNGITCFNLAEPENFNLDLNNFLQVFETILNSYNTKVSPKYTW